MREIKFRAWFVDKMFYGIPSIRFNRNGVTRVNLNHDDNDFDQRYDTWTGDDDYVLMQSTGLKDRNGVEIFEGDCYKRTVKINKELHGEWAIYQFVIQNGLTIISYVRSEKDTGIPEGYLASPYTDEFDVDMKTILFANSVTLDCEVIGNVWEHKHLLK